MKKKDWLVRMSVAVISAAMIVGATPVSAIASEEQETEEETAEEESGEAEEPEDEEKESGEAEKPEVEEEESGEAEETEDEEEESGEAEEPEVEEEESGEAEETEDEEEESGEAEEPEVEEEESGEAEETEDEEELGEAEETEVEEENPKETEEPEAEEELEEPPVIYNGDGTSPALIAADGYSILDVQEYLKNISLVSVDGEDYRVLGDADLLILENGKLNIDAKPFERGEFFEIQVAADGYFDLEFVYWALGEWEYYGDSDISIPLIDDVNHVCVEETDRTSKDPSIISREVYQVENEETVTWGYRILRRVSRENGR